jgi:hypothetical protein
MYSKACARLAAEHSGERRDRGGEKVLPTTRRHEVHEESELAGGVIGVETSHGTRLSVIRTNDRIKSRAL